MSKPAGSLAESLEAMSALDPKEAAARLIRARATEPDWLDAFTEALDRRRSAESLDHTLSAWDLNQSDAARIFGVTRQAISKWLDHGVPAERSRAVADLSAATDILVHHLKRERIPAVVRRPAPALRDRSLLDLAIAGETGAMLRACREMFSFADAHA